MQFTTQGIYKTLLGLALATTLAGSAYAAEAGHHHHHNPLQRLQVQLNLTQDQVARLQPTFDSFKQRHEAERAQSRARFEAMLTPDQLARLRADRDASKGHEEEKGEHRGHGMKDLNLTEAQKAQMKSFWDQNKSAHAAERQQMDSQVMAVLTPDQQAKFQEMKKHWGEHRGHHRHGGKDGQSQGSGWFRDNHKDSNQ